VEIFVWYRMTMHPIFDIGYIVFSLKVRRMYLWMSLLLVQHMFVVIKTGNPIWQLSIWNGGWQM